MNHVSMLSVLLSLGCVMPIASVRAADETPGEPSPTWQRYVDQKQRGVPTDLPDYSWAGYARGERAIPEAEGKRFDVTDYGATPDDLVDDRDAIQRAIDAAAANGGGVVYLPAGRYLVNTRMSDRGTLRIEASNIVLKGAGSRAGGTVIHQIQPFGGGNPHDYRRMHLGDNILLIRSKADDRRLMDLPVLSRITADSARETFAVSVDDTTQVQPGDQVYLYARNGRVFEKAIQPHGVDPRWVNIVNNQAYAVEIHTVAEVEANRVTFAEPIRYDIAAEDGWELRRRQPISDVGVEDICFMGNAWHPYEHHRSGMDDSGWAMIKIKGITDSYVRRCTFLNVSQSVYVAQSSYVSLLNLTYAGNPGHHTPRVVYFSYGVFAGLVDDRAGFTHGPSVQGGSLGTVFWRWRANSPLDSHAGRPYVTLVDDVSVTGIHCGGGVRDFPQHLRWLTLWNVHFTGESTQHYEFWQPQGYHINFVQPLIVGAHGTPLTFNQSHVGLVESQGQPVNPRSLYEAQLALRLGTLPEWLGAAEREREALAAQPLPAFYDRNDPASPSFLFPERFAVSDTLGYLTTESLQMNDSKLFTYSIADESLALETDQSFVRHTVYALMKAIYNQTPNGNTIHAEAATVEGQPGVRFTLTSGPIARALPDLASDPLTVAAVAMAQRIDARVSVAAEGDRLGAVVEVPSLPAGDRNR